MDCRQLLISFRLIKHLPKNLKDLLPSDIAALILKLLEKLVNAFVGVHVFLPGRDEKSKQWRQVSWKQADSTKEDAVKS